MAGRTLTREFLIDCCTDPEGWAWIGQGPRWAKCPVWLANAHALVLVDENCGVMGFPAEFAGRFGSYRAEREMLLYRGEQVVMTEDASRRHHREGIDRRVYVGGGSYAACVQERLGKLLDGLTVKYSVSGGKLLGLAGYDAGGTLVTIVAPLADSWGTRP